MKFIFICSNQRVIPSMYLLFYCKISVFNYSEQHYSKVRKPTDKTVKTSIPDTRHTTKKNNKKNKAHPNGFGDLNVQRRSPVQWVIKVVYCNNDVI